MALKAGKIGDLDSSMANDIENAFMAEWGNVMKDALGNPLPTPAPNNTQMQLLFVAIAQGVVNHLKSNHTAFTVEVDTHTHTIDIA